MRTMRIIDLFNKIANGEEVPKEIIYKLHIWKYDNDMEDYYWEDYKNSYWLINKYLGLNDEIKIIEKPKKIEKLAKNITDNACATKDQRKMAKKINEIIDYIIKGDSNE